MPYDDSLNKIFDRYLIGSKIFKNRDILRHDYIPDKLPHRGDHIEKLGNILAPSLNGDKVSNIFIYGKTGTGKTAVTKYVISQLENKSKVIGSNLHICYVNCRMSGTVYRILSILCGSLEIKVPFTGLSTNELLERYRRKLSSRDIIELIVLDEIDALIRWYGDDSILYKLTRINELLRKGWIGIIGISNDLHFKEFLDARVLSTLSEEEVVFRPYLADELYDILFDRVEGAFLQDTLHDSTLKLCSALAAKEHGDARRALDLLRVAGETAEREGCDFVLEKHVQQAQRIIDHDRFSIAIKSLPLHSKIVLLSSYCLEKIQLIGYITGDIYQEYLNLCKLADIDPLTQRRISGLINELDIMGLLNAQVISFGRYGRTKKIRLGLKSSIIEDTLKDDDIVGLMLNHVPKKIKRRKN